MNNCIICPLCKSDDVSPGFTVQGHVLYSCNFCDLIFIHPYIQKESDRNPLPAEDQYQFEKNTIDGYFHHISEFFTADKTILDIGCGCGVLLEKARDSGITARQGIEPDPRRAAYARTISGTEIISESFMKADFKDEYSLITLINVFSHLTDINQFFHKVSGISQKHAHVIMKTGLLKRGFGKNNFFNWQIPEHIHFMGERTPRYIAEKNGYTLVKQINIPLGNELFSDQYLKSKGNSGARDKVKALIALIPFASAMIRKLYALYTKNKVYSTILVFRIDK